MIKDNNRYNKTNEIINIIKFISLSFCGITFFSYYFDIKEFETYPSSLNNLFNPVILLIVVLFFIYKIWDFFYIDYGKKNYKSRVELKDLIEIILFWVSFTILIIFSNNSILQYKILYLFIIITSTIQFGKRIGLILSVISSLTILTIDLFSLPLNTINKTFETDLVFVGIFILTAWLLGDYVTVEREYSEMLLNLANIDELTGLYNHRFFHESLERSVNQSKTSNEPVSLLFLDIDYFKRYNDLYGHLAGDMVLSQLGNVLKNNIRENDIAARYGGEEFAIILPKTSEKESMELGEKIRINVEKARFEGEGNLPNGNLTISVGVSTFPNKAKTKLELLKSSDDALFRAKFFNKNKVESYDSILEELKQDIEQDHIDLISSIKTLISVINAKDRYTYGHTERVVIYCQLMSHKLDLSDEEKRILKFGSYLHDIGKIEIPMDILNKKMRLDEHEWNLIKQHPENGVNIINPVTSLEGIIPLIMHHHEKYDGSGYPQGLKGQEIPYLARILTIADSFDAMTSDRPYNTRKSYQEAIVELQRCKYSQFDPHLVDVFLEVIEEYSQYLDTFKFKEVYCINA